jgi:hypothetical protein
MKQTAVEWLVEKLKSQSLLIGEPNNLVAVNQAKEMEKEQKSIEFNSGEKNAEKNYEFYIQHLERQNKLMKETILYLHKISKDAFDEFFTVIETQNKLDINSKERISIYNVNMSKRVLNVLRSIDINYLDEISLWTKKEISLFRNVGKTVLIELEKIMIEYEIKFRY